jgi:hypothetical protein
VYLVLFLKPGATCIKESAMQMTSVGLLGNFLEMAISFLEVHRAQVNPANIKMINLDGRGPLPINQVMVKSLKEEGAELNWNTSLMTLHCDGR